MDSDSDTSSGWERVPEAHELLRNSSQNLSDIDDDLGFTCPTVSELFGVLSDTESDSEDEPKTTPKTAPSVEQDMCTHEHLKLSDLGTEPASIVEWRAPQSSQLAGSFTSLTIGVLLLGVAISSYKLQNMICFKSDTERDVVSLPVHRKLGLEKHYQESTTSVAGEGD